MPTKRTMGSESFMRAESASAGTSRQALFLYHPPGVVERLGEGAHHLVDLSLADYQRRAEGDDVAGHVAQDDPVLLRAAHQIRGHSSLGVEALLGRFVANELQRTDQADAARFANQRMPAVTSDCVLQARTDASHRSDDVALLVDLERLECDRCRDRMR